MKNLSELIGDLSPLIYNPAAVQGYVNTLLSAYHDGETVELMDPNNPVVFTIENAIMMSAATVASFEDVMKIHSPVMATNYSEIYPHMADVDFLDRFSQPCASVFKLFISKAEIRAKAVPLESMDTRKIVIPRDTAFMLDGYTFTIQYPIVISLMPHGGIMVNYDISSMSPIKPLTSNMLTWETYIQEVSGLPLEGILVEIPVLQYSIKSTYDNITVGLGFKEAYSFTDQFFYARVWNKKGGKWVELSTTHTDLIYDPYKPTAVLSVTDSAVTVYIPEIYLSKNLVTGDIRVDVYSSKGAINFDMRGYNGADISVKYNDLNIYTNPAYIAPLGNVTDIAYFTDSLAIGGRNSLSFNDLRDRVIANSIGSRQLPISEKQLESTLMDLGFKVVKSIDYVTNRIYLASTEMPASTIDGLSTPIGTMNGILDVSLEDLAKLSTVKDNGNRITVLPTTLYRLINGTVSLSENITIDTLLADNLNRVVSTLNSNKLLYSPFHYVYDINGSNFEIRPYDLSTPSIVQREFININSTLLLELGTTAVSLNLHDEGYSLIVVTNSGDTYKSLNPSQRFVQLSFSPTGYTNEYAYLNGTEIGTTAAGEVIFEFVIKTNFDIDKNHSLILDNFTMLGGVPTPIPAVLELDFNLIYGVSNYITADFKPTNIDTILNTGDLSNNAIGVTQERLRVHLGEHLPNLWSNARTIVGSAEYVRYEEDVVAVYSKDVFDRDIDTGIAKYVMVDGRPMFDILHHRGDPILDAVTNLPQIRFKAGDVVLDGNSEPTIYKPRTVIRQVDLFLADARYLLSSTTDTKAYMDIYKLMLLDYITNQIPEVGKSVLEKTILYFYPHSNMGLIDVLTGDGSEVRIDAEMQFNVSYYLTKAARSNVELLTTLGDITREVIVSNLTKSVIGVDQILSDIRSRVSGDILGVSMESFGVDKDQAIYTVVNSNTKPMLGKKVVANPDGTIRIKDDIVISFNTVKNT